MVGLLYRKAEAGIEYPHRNPETGTNVGFSTFVNETLGLQVPTSGMVEGGSVTIGESGETSLPVGTSETIMATDSAETFAFDQEAAADTASTTRAPQVKAGTFIGPTSIRTLWSTVQPAAIRRQKAYPPGSKPDCADFSEQNLWIE